MVDGRDGMVDEWDRMVDGRSGLRVWMDWGSGWIGGLVELGLGWVEG